MRARKTLLSWINELGGMGFIHGEEHRAIKQRIESRYNGMGLK